MPTSKKFALPQLDFSTPKKLVFAIKEIFTLLWKIDRRLFLLLLALNIIDGVLIFPSISLEKLILDKTLKSIGGPLWQEAIKSIIFLVSLRFLLQITQDVSRRFIALLNNLQGRKFSDKIELMLGEKYSSLDLSTIEDPLFKDRYNKVERESRSRAWSLAGTFYEIPNSITGILSSLAIIIFFKPLFVLILVILIIPSFIIESKLAKEDYEIETKNSFKKRIWGWLSYYLIRPRGYMEVRLLKIRDYLKQCLEAIQNEIFTEKQSHRTKRQLSLFLVTIPQQIFSSFLTIFFAYLVIIGNITLGSAEAFTRALVNFRSNVLSLMRSIVDIFESYLYISDLIWFLDLKPDIDSHKGTNFPQKLTQGVKFDHVWFRYTDSSPWIIKDVNFEIGAHENLAIVGDNGAGKTTLIKLLCRFYDPSQGQILLDGIDLREYKRNEYWDKLSVLFQEFETYPFTARESIGYGNVNEINNLELIRKFAKKTDIDGFVMELPKQYETPVSREFEGGIAPSYGQYQRLAIARSLMRDSSILVLDEPTSNVDPQAEEDIFNQILKLGKEKILIFISHRFSTVRKADKIILLDGGTVKEYGTHKQLLTQKGKYAKLFALQAKSYK